MISRQPTLIRREIWEHPAIWATPLVIAVVVCLLTVTGQVSVSAFGDAVNLAIAGVQNVGEAHRAAVITGMLSGVSMIFAVGAGIVTVFYSLDALYAERKDKSILFWRSLPITDAETVTSKLLTALFVVPLATVVVAMVTHLLILVLMSIWVKVLGGDAMHLIWSSVRLGDVWATCVVLALFLPLWFAPFIGWFLFVSTYAKRSPFLIGFLPIIVLPLLEKMLVGTRFFGDAIFVRAIKPPIVDFSGFQWNESDMAAQMQDVPRLFDQIDLAGFFASPSLWAGLAVCAVFTFAAIYVRRYRDESY